jgi:hypothetical protein
MTDKAAAQCGRGLDGFATRIGVSRTPRFLLSAFLADIMKDISVL